MKHKLFLFTFLLAILSAINIQASERKKYNFNSEWKLRIGDFPKAKDTKFDDSKWKQVTLPHAFNEDEAFKLSIEQLTDTVVWYRKSFQIPELKSNQKVFVEFEGVRQRGDFYLNGHYLGRHENGVMAVGFDLTPHIKEGENVIAVRTDNDWMYREEGGVTESASTKGANDALSHDITMGLGGKSNIESVDCCATRLRLTVSDSGKVSDQVLKQTIHRRSGSSAWRCNLVW